MKVLEGIEDLTHLIISAKIMVLQDKIKYQKALQALLQKISYGFQHYSKGMTDMINQRLHQCIKHLKLNLCLYKSNNTPFVRNKRRMPNDYPN